MARRDDDVVALEGLNVDLVTACIGSRATDSTLVLNEKKNDQPMSHLLSVKTLTSDWVRANSGRVVALRGFLTDYGRWIVSSGGTFDFTTYNGSSVIDLFATYVSPNRIT